jgi:vancomycin resistance protein YoaR
LSAPASARPARYRRRRSRVGSPALARTLALAAVLGCFTLVVGLSFAGSKARLAEGTHIAGIDVGGLSPKEAHRLLERRSAELARTPVTFTIPGRTFRITPERLGVEVDWAAAVRSAERQGEGFAPVRGFKRLRVRLFPGDLRPPVRVYEAALQYELAQLAAKIDGRPREAALVRRGLKIVPLPGRTGTVLKREAAGSMIVRSLASFDRDGPVSLPVQTEAPTVRVADLRSALAGARLAVSAPVRLVADRTAWRLPRWRIAKLLELPADGRTDLRIGGPAAGRWFAGLQRKVARPPANAGFAVSGTEVRIVPARPGVAIDVPGTAAAILAAATTPGDRVARLATTTAAPKRSTDDARAMGITGLVGSYTTIYGGDPNRLHNVRLVAELVDNHLIAPGTTFSFNAATGERTAAKGFLEAPVIINGELQTGLGGGVCQVSTTVFNAAFEAGLPIEARTNHALYISHYPLGRDATVNYPDTDLKFRNDTDHWMLVRTFVGSSALTVGIYGTPQHRRIETETAPLRETGGPKVVRTKDPTLAKGKIEVDDFGEPSRATSVRRTVYAPDGKLLYDTTWYSSYVSEPKLVRVGTKKPEPEPATPKTEVPHDVPVTPLAPAPADAQR